MADETPVVLDLTDLAPVRPKIKFDSLVKSLCRSN